MRSAVRRSFLLLLTGLVLTAACGGAPAEREAVDSAPAVPVTLGRVAPTEWMDTVEAGGVVRSRSTAAISSRILAPVLAVHVRAGDRVRRGQTLIELDASELAAQSARAAASLQAVEQSAQAATADVAGAEAALELARATHERIRTLHEQRSATSQELDEAAAGLAAATARLAAARAQATGAMAALEAARSAARACEITAAYGAITAPFDAVVAERHVDPGSLATPGLPLLLLEGPGALQLEVQVDATRAGAIAPGTSVEVRVDTEGPDSPWREGRVAEIARVDPGSHSFTVKIDVDAGTDWRSGLFGRARFPIGSRTALTMPAGAAVRRGQLVMAFVVDAEQRARLRAIRTGDQRGERIEVLSGLADRDRVVVHAPAGLEDGRLVSATPSSGGGR
jgi:RND family efflux transporter MFP subunit